jgi:hypothetical protein
MKIKNESTFSPRGLVGHVERGLGWINPLDVKGISFIRLLDDLPKPTDRSPHWQKDLKKQYLYVNGLYMGKHENEPAYINLYVRNLYRGIPSFLFTTPIPTLTMAYILGHEVGHHLIHTRGYIFQPTEVFKHKEIVEEFCDRYAVGILKKMLASRRYRFWRWAVKMLAEWHLAMGSFNEGLKKPNKAAYHFMTAFHLDNDRENALYSYWQQQELATPKKVSDASGGSVLSVRGAVATR